MKPRLITLGRRHAALMTAHLLALDATDRNNRFMGSLSDQLLGRYVAGIRFEQDLLIGAMQGERLVGMAHAARYNQGSERVVEVGLSVLADARGQGWGKRRLQAAIAGARQLHVDRAYVVYRSGNMAMAALARSAGGALGGQGEESFAYFDLSLEVAQAVKPAPQLPMASAVQQQR